MKYLKLFENFNIDEGYKDVGIEYVKTKFPKMSTYLPSKTTKIFDKYLLINEFYEDFYHKTPNEIWGIIRAFDLNDETEIGNANYGLFHGVLSGSIEVREDKQRQKIGTEMYKYIEELTNMKIYPSYPHSDKAEKFWSQPNRPFGEY